MFLTNYDEPVIFSGTATLVVLIIIGVLIGLIALMMAVKAVGARKAKGGETPQSAAERADIPPVAVQPDIRSGRTPAPGSQGDVDLYNVDDHTAALLMAIVADDLKADLNTLRFTSIREAAR